MEVSLQSRLCKGFTLKNIFLGIYFLLFKKTAQFLNSLQQQPTKIYFFDQKFPYLFTNRFQHPLMIIFIFITEMLMMPSELKMDLILTDKRCVLNYPVQKAHLVGVVLMVAVVAVEWVVVDTQGVHLCQVSHEPLSPLFLDVMNILK